MITSTAVGLHSKRTSPAWLRAAILNIDSWMLKIDTLSCWFIPCAISVWALQKCHHRATPAWSTMWLLSLQHLLAEAQIAKAGLGLAKGWGGRPKASTAATHAEGRLGSRSPKWGRPSSGSPKSRAASLPKSTRSPCASSLASILRVVPLAQHQMVLVL